jgi:NAD(P)-dependent dehydrogenase (short-subunit alcohol dehydrogenase family)
MNRLEGRTAVVTGATGGIGKAVTLALAGEGARLVLLGRDQERLEEVARTAGKSSPGVDALPSDLAIQSEVEGLAPQIEEKLGGVDILVFCAGVYSRGRIDTAPLADLDSHLQVNLRAPARLTRDLLPSLISRQGQVVFMNSSVGSAPEVGFYSASKHALKAFTDTLRAEVNPAGVRVLSVYPGRTATPMQESIFAAEGRSYDPSRLLQPEDVAEMVLAALCLPRTAEVTDLHIRPLQKS